MCSTPPDLDPDFGVWFALGSDGVMYCLSNCGDFEAAEESAEDLGIHAVWIADPTTARQWLFNLQSNQENPQDVQ